MDNKENVYLAGLPRGGTTLVSQIIGQHSFFEQMGEAMYTAILNPDDFYCSCGRVSCPVSKRIFELARNDKKIITINRTYGLLDRIREPNKISHKLSIRAKDEDMACIKNLPQMIEDSCEGIDNLTKIFSYIFGKLRFIDNTKEILFAEKLADTFRWKIILITRDPRGIAWSSKKAGIRKSVDRDIESKIPVYSDFAKRAILLKDKKTFFILGMKIYAERQISQ